MIKSIRQLGDASFLGDPQVLCRVYEWSAPNSKKFGSFKVKFVCPKEDGPRRFFAVPVLQNWANPEKQKGFLERACRCGNKILASLDQPASGQQESFPVFLALFRNRNEGHTKIRRTFKSILEFGDFSGPLPKSVAPGLKKEDGQWRESLRETIQEIVGFSSANDLIEQYQDDIEFDWAEKIGKTIQEIVGFSSASDPIQQYQEDIEFDGAEKIGRSPQLRLARLDELYGRSTIDLFFTEGVWRLTEFDFQKAMENVRRALIYGQCRNADFRAAMDDPEFPDFASRMAEGVKGRSPTDFTKWLRNLRQHGYLKLLRQGYKLDETEKATARERAGRMFCAMLWLSYQEMARCYGALMFVCWSRFTLELELTSEEDALFRQINFPQLYLAGLPLAFLGVNHWRWIAAPLLKNWNAGVFAPEAYDPLTKILGLYAGLVADKRESDRHTKSDTPPEVPLDGTESSIDSKLASKASDSVAPQEPDSLPVLKSNRCSACGEELKDYQYVEPLADERFIVRLYCKECDKHFCFRTTADYLSILKKSIADLG